MRSAWEEMLKQHCGVHYKDAATDFRTATRMKKE
jgi:hypothetical protein